MLDSLCGTRMFSPAAALALVCICLPTQDPKPAKPPVAKLSSLAWMAGHWRSDGARQVVEEVWMAPRGGLMLGLNRAVPKRRGRTQFEYLRIEERRDGVYYVASPGGRGATPFKLIESEAGRAVFANPENDFPTHITYRLLDGGVLEASATDGDGNGPSWKFERVTK